MFLPAKVTKTFKQGEAGGATFEDGKVRVQGLNRQLSTVCSGRQGEGGAAVREAAEVGEGQCAGMLWVTPGDHSELVLARHVCA